MEGGCVDVCVRMHVCICVCVWGGWGGGRVSVLEGYEGERWTGGCVDVCVCMHVCICVCVCGGGGESVCWRGIRVRDGGGLCGCVCVEGGRGLMDVGVGVKG